jgi:hypothetical protein
MARGHTGRLSPYRRKPDLGLAFRKKFDDTATVKATDRTLVSGTRAERCECVRLGLKLHQIRPKKLCKAWEVPTAAVAAATGRQSAGEERTQRSATDEPFPTGKEEVMTFRNT